jgi:hypothetical protein
VRAVLRANSSKMKETLYLAIERTTAEVEADKVQAAAAATASTMSGLTSHVRLTFVFVNPGSFGFRFNKDGKVTKVESGGQAELVGFQVDDVIVQVGDAAVSKATLIPQLKALGRPGNVTVDRPPRENIDDEEDALQVADLSLPERSSMHQSTLIGRDICASMNSSMGQPNLMPSMNQSIAIGLVDIKLLATSPADAHAADSTPEDRPIKIVSPDASPDVSPERSPTLRPFNGSIGGSGFAADALGGAFQVGTDAASVAGRINAGNRCRGSSLGEGYLSDGDGRAGRTRGR